MNVSFIILAAALQVFTLSACAQNQSAVENRTAITKDTCDDPDAHINCSFAHMPQTVSNVMTITTKHDGDPLVVQGRITGKDGKPIANVVMYGYHTDERGYYTKKGNEKGAQKWHGHLHGWCKTGDDGRYTIKTIRPAPYPSGGNPAHIHAALKLPDMHLPFYITDFVFHDDPSVTAGYAAPANLQGGNGIMHAVKDASGTWRATRDISLNR